MNKSDSQRKKKPVNPLSKNRLLLLKTISILLPFLLLFLFEISLHVFKYGHNLDLFVEYPGNKDFLVLNHDASKRYFTDEQIATTGNIEVFKKHKDKNTLRLFVLGESTTLGYPYFHNGSFHRWLQYRLMQQFPDQNFEIINLSLTAVNSYTVYGFAREVVNYEPDAVLIYTGHNEYYGALGVGSTNNIGNNPALVNLILTLRQLRTVQLMSSLYQKITRLFVNGQPASGKSRMEFMVADQQIPYGSEQYKNGVEQFRSNMDHTLEILNKHQIPVFLSNLVSNEQDLKPFVSFEPDKDKSSGFDQQYKQGLQAFNHGDMKTAAVYFKAADQRYQGHASCNYYLAKIALASGDTVQAKSYFTKAKDLDGLRFRAPEALNTIITQLSTKYKNVHLVDTKSVFEAYSANHIIGHGLILEHVHPNLMGYALLSDVFYQSLKKEKVLPAGAEKEMSFKQLLQNMPVTKVDSLAGIYRIAKLKKSWPFSEALQADTLSIQSVEEKLAYRQTNKEVSWYKATDEIYNYYIGQNDLANASRVIEGLVLEYPTEGQYYERAGMINGKLKNYQKVLFYFKKAFLIAPSFDKARYLFVIYLQLDRPAEAIPYLDYAISNNTSNFNLQPVKAAVERVIQLKSAYAKDSVNLSILDQIAGTYIKMDNADAASRYLRQILKKDSKNKKALAALSAINNNRRP